jgi:hypothetical protein
MTHLVIFHYHLLPGGVTDVIVQGVMALARSSRHVTHVTLVCGRNDNSDHVYKRLTAYLSRHKSDLKLDINIMPDIDYLNHTEELADIEPRLAVLQKKLITAFASPSNIWWIHNYQLGKNPLFSEVILRIIESGIGQRIMLQIHDFPEAGRPHNLLKLKKIVSHPLYPAADTVRYLVINSRDSAILQKAGLPADLVYLAENPISSFSHQAQNPARVKQILSVYGGRLNRNIGADTPLVIYPVRAIRRKNVLEAGLITRLLPGSPLLLVTLPGVSAAEKSYSSFVEDCFNDGLIPGFFGLGTRLDKMGIGFASLLAASSLMCCSSVQEGFGYPYLQALLLGLPLLARRLDVMDGFIRMFEHYPSHFYTSLLVPLEAEDTTGLKRAYMDHIRALRRTYEPALLDSLTAEVEALFHNRLIDFSFLSFSLQRKMLERALSADFQNQVKAANPTLFKTAGELLRAAPRPKQEHVLSRYGFGAYTETIDQVIESFSQQVELGTVRPETIDDAVLRLFGSLANLRLLFAPRSQGEE